MARYWPLLLVVPLVVLALYFFVLGDAADTVELSEIGKDEADQGDEPEEDEGSEPAGEGEPPPDSSPDPPLGGDAPSGPQPGHVDTTPGDQW